MFVGAFIIFNTFSIVVAQRMREHALLRALGATGAQIMGSVLVDALVVGIVSSAAGIVAGFGIAAGLTALLGAFDIDLPSTELVLLPRTILVGLGAGTLVTLVAAVEPARRAARISPMAIFREVEPQRSVGCSRARSIAGGLVVASGVGLPLVASIAGVPQPAVLVGLGAAITFIGMAVIGPLFAGPLVHVIGSPAARWRGVPARWRAGTRPGIRREPWRRRRP